MRQEGYFNPVAARYRAAASVDGEPRTYPGFNIHFFDSIPAEDDATEGHLWPLSRFVVVSETWTRPQWRADGRRIGTITHTAGWKNPRRQIKSRGGASESWEDADYELGPLSAGFDGVVFGAEHYFRGPLPPGDDFPEGIHPRYTELGATIGRYLSEVVETRTVDSCDFEPERRAATTEWVTLPGIQHLFADGSTYSHDTEIGRTRSERSQFATVAGMVRQIDTATDHAGRAVPVRPVTDGAQGGIPAAEICRPEDVDREREQTFTVEVCLTRKDGAGDDVEDRTKPLDLESVWVETDAEAEAWARLELRIALSPEITLALASPIPVIDAGDVVELTFPEIGLEGLAKVWSSDLTVEGGEGGRVKHVLGLRLPPATQP